MSIESKNWIARDDRMPGVNTLKVSGTVIVNTSDTVPVLTRSDRPAILSHLILELTLQQPGIGAQVMTEKPVVYTQLSGASITSASIYYNGELLASIDNVETTH